ncbi:hypothetical protein EMCRGX_G002306 [Ephydatia muelleri]
MAAIKSLLLVLSCVIGVSKCSQVAVIILEQSFACNPAYYITEGNNATACATIVYTYGNLPLATNISVLFTTSNGTALSPKDYGAVSEVRVFTEGSVEGQSLCVTVTTVDDSVVEGIETFQITLSANSPNVTIGDRAGGVAFTVNVNDNDAATVALVTNFTSLYKLENDTSIHLCAQLVKNELEISVSAYLYANSGTATVGYDTYGGGEIGFSSGSPIGSVSCGDYYIVDDNRVENKEDFTIILGGRYRTVVTSSNNTVHVTIIDNDIALIGLRNGNPTTTPETDTMLSVCIALTNAAILDIPINVDFEAISGTATSKLKCRRRTRRRNSRERPSAEAEKRERTPERKREGDGAGEEHTSGGEPGEGSRTPGTSTVEPRRGESRPEQRESRSENCEAMQAEPQVGLRRSDAPSAAPQTAKEAEQAERGNVERPKGHEGSARERRRRKEKRSRGNPTRESEKGGRTAPGGRPARDHQRRRARWRRGGPTNRGRNAKRRRERRGPAQGRGRRDKRGAGGPETHKGRGEEGKEKVEREGEKGKDFIQVESGNFVFTPGNTIACIHINILQDSILEYNEYILFSTSCNNSHAVCSAGSGSIQIIEDGDTVTIGFDVESFNGTEGSSDPLKICAVMMEGSLERLIPVYVTTHAPGATATAGKDYIPLVATTVMFSYGASARNQTASCVDLSVMNDSILENTESLSVSVSSLLLFVFISPSMNFAFIYIFEDPNDYITIGFASGAPSIVTEGLNLTLKLCPEILNGSLEKDVTVFATTMDITATSPSDYGYEYVELKFSYGQRVGDKVCFFIGINNDVNVLEYTEQFEVSLTQCCKDIYFPPQQGSILVTILEEPADGITVGFRSSSYQRDETGGPILVCIQMYNGNIERNVSMEIMSNDGTAEAYLDYVPLNSTITFIYGMSSGSTICTYATIIDDDVVEEDVENFNLSIIATEPPVTTISLSLSTISIQERNNDAVEIGLNQRRYVGTEGGSVIVCAKIFNGYIERTVSVYLSAYSGTANEGTDFIGVSRVVLKMPMYSSVNDTICTDIMITNDTDIEPEEQFTITLETVDPAVNITFKTGIVLILIDSHDVTEGRNSSFPICASLKSLSGTLTTSVSVGLVTNDISSFVHVGQDYVMETRAFVFPASSIPGVTFMCSTVFIIDDNILENTEEVNIFLVSNETSVVLDNEMSQTIVRIMEDNHDSITVGFSVPHSVVNETQGDVEICIEMIHGALERNVSVYLQAIPITDAENFQELLLPTLEDQDVVLIPAVLSVDVVTIIEDSHDGIEVGFEPNSYNVSASDGMVLVCVAIYKGTLERDVAVLMVTSIDANRTDGAILGYHFTSVHVVVQFISGQSEVVNRTRCISIGIVNDVTTEPVEEFLVFLDKVAADSSVVDFSEGFSNATVHIHNADYVFQFVNTSYVQLEGSPVIICLQIIKYPQNDQVQTIPVILSTRSVSATGGQDYDDSMHVILFRTELLNGTMTECTAIQIIDDHAIEGDETFEVNLIFLYSSSTSVTNRNSAVVTIRQSSNNYAVGMFVDNALTGVAGEDIKVCVLLEDATGDIKRTLNVSVSTINETAFRGEDYELLGPETLSFSPGSTIGSTECLTVQLVNKISANVISFVLQLTSDDPALKILKEFAMLSIRILHTLLPVSGVSMTAKLAVAKEELRVAELCAIIKRGTIAHDTVFPVFVLGTTATETEDYVSDNVTINFKSGDTVNSTRCTSVSIVDDNLLESNETFFAILLSSDDDALTASPTVTRVVIQDDRGKVIEIGFETTNYTVWESNTSISVCCKILHTNLTLGRPLEIVVLVLSNLTTATGYSVPRSFEFAVGMAENSLQCIDVTIHDDEFVEDDEELVLKIESLDPNAFVTIVQDYSITTLYIKEDSNDFIEIHWVKENYAAQESEDVELCAQIGGGALRKDVVVTVNVSLNTATFGDFYLLATALIFKSGQSAVSTNSRSCIMVHIIDDMFVEMNESFSIKLLSSDIVHVSPSNDTTTVTILDDLSDVISIEWSERVYNAVEEDTNVLICASIINGTLETNVTVPFTYSQGTASKGNDFTVSSWFLAFSSGQSQYNHSTSCASVFIINDSILEDTESFILEFTSTNKTRYLSIGMGVNITIYEDPTDVAVFSMIQDKYTVTEGLNNTILLCAALITGSLEKPVMLNLESEVGASMDSYNAYVKGPITFQPGNSAADNSTQCFVLNIINDDIVEDTQEVFLRLTALSSGCIIYNNSSPDREVEIIIFDDPTDVLTVVGALQTTLVVPFKDIPGTATIDTDYLVSSWSLKFMAGQSQYNQSTSCASVLIINDTILEDTEYLTLKFISANRTKYLPFRTDVIFTIYEDPNDMATFSLVENRFMSTEGVNSTVLMCILLSIGSLEKTVTMSMENEVGTSVMDYKVDGPIVFLPGSSDNDKSTECFIVNIIDDDIVEGTEVFILNLTVNSSGCRIVGDPSSSGEVELTIIDDPTDVITIGWSRSYYVITEGEDSQIFVCADILHGTLQTSVIVPFININFTGTAITGSDLTLSSWFLTFISGQSQYNQSTSCISMFIINDTTLEDTENLILELTPANRTTYLPFRNVANITINEDQNDGVEFSLIENSYVVTEGSNNTLSVCILLKAGNLAKPVELILQSQSKSLTDYSIEGSTIFQPGSSAAINTTQCFVLNITNDDIVENTEQFLLILNVASSYCTVSGEAEVNLTIIEDPADVVTLFLQSSNYYIREASSSDNLEVCGVIQKGSLERDVSVAIVATNGTAIYGADYTLESTDLTFTSGQNQSYNTMQCKTITIHVIDDSILEYNESFSLSIVAAHPAIPGATNEITVVIKEDPSDFVEIGLAQLLYEVDQDFVSVPLQIDVEMVSGNLQRNVSLTISLASKPTTSIATLGVNALFMNTTTFTYGESSGAVHQEMLNISSIHGNEFASVILQPIPKDRDVIRIANAQAFIEISVHSAPVISLPGVVGGTSLVLILICATLLLLAAMTILYKKKKANKPAPISVAPHLLKSPSQQSRATTMDYIAVEELI